MKISNMGIDYKVVKCKGKPHTCIGCSAHRTYDLCNELRAQYWGKTGKPCSTKHVFQAIPPKSTVRKIATEGMLNIDKGKKALLTNYLNYLDSCFPYLESGTITKSQVKILHSYHHKLRLSFHLPPKGDSHAATQAS